MVAAAKTILCIEDDRDTASLIAEELVDRGFEVVVAHEGHEGFVSILKGVPDLVLCDVGLPQMSGFDLLERLNQLSPRLEKVPFVFLTALASRDDELRGRQLGADDYVTKPIDFDILESIINARLAGIARNEIWPKLTNLIDLGGARQDIGADRANARYRQANDRFPPRQCPRQAWRSHPYRSRRQSGDRAFHKTVTPPSALQRCRRRNCEFSQPKP
jgi:DNA-binding response OmpR family regulator